jgi:hypothetical protein
MIKDSLVLYLKDEEEAKTYYKVFKDFSNFKEYLDYTCNFFIT